MLFAVQVKSGFACEEDVKTIKCQISGRVQQLMREREVRRLCTAAAPVSAVDSQSPLTTMASQMPSATSNQSASANRLNSPEKDGYIDG